MERRPPDDVEDDSESILWGEGRPQSPASKLHVSPNRPVRMVASVTDPSITDDGLGLTGPGAPKSGFGGAAAVHPVRAKLLERSRAADTSAESEPELSTTPNLWTPNHSAGEWRGPEQRENETQFIDDGQLSPDLLPPAPGGSWSAEEEKTSVAADEVLEAPPQADFWKESGSAPALAPLNPLPGTPPPGAVATELERIARRPRSERGGQSMSPNMIAVLGGFLGLTVISTLGLVLSRTESASPGANVDTNTEDPVAIPSFEEEKKTETTVRKKLPGPWRIADDAAKPGNRVLKGTIGKNAFLRAIQDAGLPKNEAYRAYSALKGLKDLDHCKSSDAFEALVNGSEKSLVAFEYSVSKEEVYQAKSGKDGRLEGSKLDLHIERNQVRRSFVHDGKSFEDSARKSGFDPGIAEIAEVSLRGHSGMSDFKRGDRIRIIAQEVTVLGEFSRYAGIEAMEILSAGAEARRIYFYPHPVEGGYFDKNGRAPYEGGWRKPIPTAPVTSKFNMKRMHPVLNKVMPHTGTDFGAPTGTPIGATAPGVISFRGPGGASGNLVKVKHEGGYESGYAHLSRFANLNVGDKVDRLQIVGYCGTTGRSTGPHLHFTMKKDDVFIDPESLNLDGMRVLAKSHREPFQEIRNKYDPILDQIPLPSELAPETAPMGTDATPSGNTMPDPSADDPSADDPSADDPSADEPGADDPDTEDEPSLESDGATAARVQQTPTDKSFPAKSQKADESPAKPAQIVTPSAIFLSDAELLKMQSRTDDGEVDQ